MIPLLVLLVALFCAFYFFISQKRPKNYPPGPWGLPIVGNLFQLQTNTFEVYADLRKRYGDVFSVDLGSLRSIVINDYKLIKEAYSHSEFAARPARDLSLDETGVNRGISFTEGRVWTEQRRFMLKNLRDYGFGVKSIDSRLQQEASEIITELKSQLGVPIDLLEHFDLATMNCLWEIASGERFAKDDPEFIRIRALVAKILKDSDTFMEAMMFPWIKYFKSAAQKKYKETLSNIHDILRKRVLQHKNSFNKDIQRDLMDCYLKQILETTDPDSSFSEGNGEPHMVQSIMDMIFPGVEAISVALSWIALSMAHFPEVQDKLHAEIMAVVGETNVPSLMHREKMPYLHAVMMEVMRYSQFIPQVFHKTTEDVQFNGFFIPKNTTVFGNFFEIMKDPEVWGDPQNFRPERFISDDGQKVIRHDAFFPFSVGKRVCPAESFAKDQLFIFVANIYQNFKVDFDYDNPKPGFEFTRGVFTLYPQPHKLVLHKRL